jgi:hypothetical protein
MRADRVQRKPCYCFKPCNVNIMTLNALQVRPFVLAVDASLEARGFPTREIRTIIRFYKSRQASVKFYMDFYQLLPLSKLPLKACRLLVLVCRNCYGSSVGSGPCNSKSLTIRTRSGPIRLLAALRQDRRSAVDKASRLRRYCSANMQNAQGKMSSWQPYR